MEYYNSAGREEYKKDRERYKGSLCIFCFDTKLRDYSRAYTGAYSHCYCGYQVMYSKETRDKMLLFFEEPYVDIIIKLLK